MKLFVIGTPLGRLDDVSNHFLEMVSQLEVLAVEDTRRAAQLLQLLQSKYPDLSLWPKKLMSYYREKERSASPEVLNILRQGQNVGLLSDAGMPGISDPGAYLVKAVREAGFKIEVVAGPSAPTIALSLCGFESALTVFVGFLPKSTSKLSKMINSLLESGYSKSLNLVFFESPYRITKTVAQLFKTFPQSQLFLGRELTKKFQELIWLDQSNFGKIVLSSKGEYTGVLNLKML